MGFWEYLLKIVVRAGVTVGVTNFIEKKFNQLVRRQILNNSIKMIIFFIALFISGKSLFGARTSLLVSSIIIFSLLVHSVVFIIPKLLRLVSTLVHYKIIPLIPMILDGVSPSEIVAYYVFSWGELAWDIKNKFDKIAKDWIPTADELFEYVRIYIGKRVLIFIISLAIYVVLFNFVAKRLLQISAMGISGLKVYLVPFAGTIDFIFKTQIMQWITG